MTKRPSSMRHLDNAIRRASDGSPEGYVKTRTLVANVVVAQMLPDGVVKGGSALKMRFGNAATRFTTDLDTATATDPEIYAQKLAEALAQGWEGFTGRIVAREPAQPQGVPQEYVMRPFDVKLSYNGKPWCTVPLEVGHNEIGDAEAIDWVELEDAAETLAEMGFPAPGKVPLMPLSHQIAQKIHAVTGGGDRARDLVDLQLSAANAHVDLAEVRRTCVRLFAYRKAQTWPPAVAKGEGWEALYAAQAAGLPVEPSVDDAVVWANGFVGRIENAGR